MSKKISRRGFLKLVSGTSLLGMGVAVTGCGQDEKPTMGGEGWLPDQYKRDGSYPAQVRGRVAIAPDNPSIVRDDEKCILCGRCIEACEKVMTVHGHYPLPLKDETACVDCGQCTLWCPTGAITERSDIDRVRAALADDSKFVVVQTAPATKVSLGEEFGLEPGTVVAGQQVAALKQLGFDAVFDTCFSADLTIMEEAAEVLRRLTVKQQELPHFTSCCPGWVKFCEYFYPELISHLSTCKSPQGIMGATIKSYFASKKDLDPAHIVSVAIMPCTAKKFEAQRQELAEDGLADVDIVLTTRELARLLKREHIDINDLDEEDYDSLLGESTGAGRIFGTTGGVTEAAVRTLYYDATHQAPPAALLDWQPVRGLKAVKEARADVPGVGAVSIAVCHGLANARQLLDDVKQHGSRWQFIEVMACPGGCIGGGGQPLTSPDNSASVREKRIAAIYTGDAKAKKHVSYENSEIHQIYDDFYGKPLSEKAEQKLHTSYVDRSGSIFDK
jgi:iron-only hydrogenase group A